MIELCNVNFHYSNDKIIDNISCTIEKGDFCAIMGLNGAGKSTLIKLIANLLPIKNGEIFIDKKKTTDYSFKDLAKKISYVPQYPDIIFDFSVYDVVLMGRNPYQSRWETFKTYDKEVVHDVMVKCNLENLQNRMLSQLSGGEMQRVLIARAMAQQAPVMLLDEPLSNLDIVHKYEIINIINSLNINNNVTILMILHDIVCAKQFAKNVIFLKNGCLKAKGSVDKIINHKTIKDNFNLSDNYIIDDIGNIRFM